MKKNKEKTNKKELFMYIKKSWKYAKKEKKKILIYLIASLLICLISAFIPIFAATQVLKLSNGLWQELLKVTLIITAIEISRNTFQYFVTKMERLIFREILSEIQVELATEVLKLETEELDKNSSGIFIERINKDSNDIANVFIELTYSISDIIGNIGIFIAIFIINKIFFIYFLFAILILFLVDTINIKKYFQLDNEFRKLNEINTGLITELIRGIRDVKVLYADNTFINKIKEKFKLSNTTRYNMAKVDNIYRWFSGTIRDMINLLFMALGIYLVKNNELTIASFLILYTYQGKVYSVLIYFTQLLERLKKFNLSAKRVYELIDNDKFKKETFGKVHLNKLNGDFEFDNVTFSYNDNQDILKNISFKIKANETVAFVGKSGSGKTTIFNLLTKLYHTNSGSIFIDGYSIDDLDHETIRKNISIITQNPYIFNFTIRENLQLVKDDLTEEEMISAAKTACLHDFIMTLENGYDTKVGEGGISLSGGQRQRLAITRALIKKSEIILFDEATSALDNETQTQIQQAIKNMQGEYTILIIAHRLSTVLDSNRILIVDEGKIVGEGTHEELLENSNIYKGLYQTEIK